MENLFGHVGNQFRYNLSSRNLYVQGNSLHLFVHVDVFVTYRFSSAGVMCNGTMRIRLFTDPLNFFWARRDHTIANGPRTSAATADDAAAPPADDAAPTADDPAAGDGDAA